MVAEPTGAWGPQALKTLSVLAHTKALQTGGEAGPILDQLLQTVSVVIRRASARAILRRSPAAPELIPAGGQIDAARAILAPTAGEAPNEPTATFSP